MILIRCYFLVSEMFANIMIMKSESHKYHVCVFSKFTVTTKSRIFFYNIVKHIQIRVYEKWLGFVWI